MFQKMLQGGSGGGKVFYQFNTPLTRDKIICGFKPKRILIETINYKIETNPYGTAAIIYDEDINPIKQEVHFQGTVNYVDINDSSNNLSSIDSDGFTLLGASHWTNANIIAIG